MKTNSNSIQQTWQLRTLINYSVVLAVLLVIVYSVSGQTNKKNDEVSIKTDQRTTVISREGQLIRLQTESPSSASSVTVANPNSSYSDVDFVAVDVEGNDFALETVVLEPNDKRRIFVADVFPEIIIEELLRVRIQVSVRPEIYGVDMAKQLPVAFFSQNDPAWKNLRLGTCPNDTIGSAGCAISSIAMAGSSVVQNFNPKTLNTYLTNNDGYQRQCRVIWSAPARIDGNGGFSHLGAGAVGSASNLKNLIDNNKFAVARSR